MINIDVFRGSCKLRGRLICLRRSRFNREAVWRYQNLSKPLRRTRNSHFSGITCLACFFWEFAAESLIKRSLRPFGVILERIIIGSPLAVSARALLVWGLPAPRHYQMYVGLHGVLKVNQWKRKESLEKSGKTRRNQNV